MGNLNESESEISPTTKCSVKGTVEKVDKTEIRTVNGKLVTVTSEVGKKKSQEKGKGWLESCSESTISSNSKSRWLYFLRSGYRAVVFNVEEYLDMMASDVLHHDDIEEYQIPWMRTAVDHRDWVDYVRDNLDIEGFEGWVKMKICDISGKTVEGFYEPTKLSGEERWNRTRNCIIGLFEFLDRHFDKMFPEAKSWNQVTFLEEEKKKKEKKKEMKKKWREGNVFETLAKKFFAELESEDRVLYQLTPLQTSKIVSRILEEENVEFPTKYKFSGKRLFEFLVAHIIRRKSKDVNFYYSDLCVIGKVYMSFIKTVGCIPDVRSVLHEVFIKNGLSRMYRVMIDLADKHMFLCFGFSDLAKSSHPVHQAFRRLISNFVDFGINHTFFVLGGILFDYNTSEMIHIEPLARSKGARFLMKFRDEREPVYLEKSYICSLIAELYWFNCFSEYRGGVEMKTYSRLDCHDACKKLMNGIFKKKFSKKVGRATIYPAQQAKKWKELVSKSFDGKYVPSKELKSALVKKITKKIFDDFKEMELFPEEEVFENMKASNLAFFFTDRLVLDRFMKVLFNPLNIGGAGMDLSLFPDDYVCLWSFDRALVLKLNVTHRKKLLETTNFAPYTNKYQDFQDSSGMETKGGKLSKGFIVKSQQDQEGKKGGIPTLSKFPWWFNRDKTIHSFMSKAIFQGTFTKKVQKKRQKSHFSRSKTKVGTTTSDETIEIIENSSKTQETVEFSEDEVKEAELPLNFFKYNDIEGEIIGNPEAAKKVEEKFLEALKEKMKKDQEEKKENNENNTKVISETK